MGRDDEGFSFGLGPACEARYGYGLEGSGDRYCCRVAEAFAIAHQELERVRAVTSTVNVGLTDDD